MGICFAFPVYDGKIPIDTAVALSYTIAEIKDSGIELAIQWGSESALIDLCRSRLVKQFLTQTTCRKLFFIDSDIIFKPEDALKLLKHSLKYPIVGAVYPRRKDPPRFFLRTKDKELIANEDGLIEVLGMGGGFVVIDRSVFEQMKPFVETVSTSTDTDVDMYFDIRYRNGEYLGEDISFYTRWVEDCKGKVFIDPTINLTHVGTRYFNYKFSDYLEKDPAE